MGPLWTMDGGGDPKDLDALEAAYWRNMAQENEQVRLLARMSQLFGELDNAQTGTERKNILIEAERVAKKLLGMGDAFGMKMLRAIRQEADRNAQFAVEQYRAMELAIESENITPAGALAVTDPHLRIDAEYDIVDQDIIKAWDAGKITTEHAYALASLAVPDMMEMAQDYHDDGVNYVSVTGFDAYNTSRLRRRKRKIGKRQYQRLLKQAKRRYAAWSKTQKRKGVNGTLRKPEG